MESDNNGDLPAEIVLEILLRLPVKTLLRFKCVCKQWYTLIGSPSFVNQHFSHESNQERLLIRHKPDERRYAMALYVDDALSRYEEPDHLQMLDSVETLMGPLNGVFCLFTKSRNIVLLNPSMRQFKPIPSQALNAEPHVSFYDDVVGFGFDPLRGDYMVFSVCFLLNYERARRIPRHTSIYNLSTDSWRHVEDAGLTILMSHSDRSCSSTYSNGVYHCVTCSEKEDVAILAFDTNSDNYQEIQVPDHINCIWNVRVALYGDTIALLSYHGDWYDHDKWVNVWVMEEVGCWTKIFTLGPFEDIKMPLCFWKNNELLVQNRDTSSWTLCNVSTLKLRTVEAPRGGPFCSWIFSYKESLVSIKREGDNCMLWDTSSDLVRNYLR